MVKRVRTLCAAFWRQVVCLYSYIESGAVKPHEIWLFQPINAHTALLPNRKIVFTEKNCKKYLQRTCEIAEYGV